MQSSKPLAPTTDPAARRRAVETVRTALDDSGWFDSVSAAETKTAVEALSRLGPADASAAVASLERQGLLGKLTRKLAQHADDDDGATLARFSSAMAHRLDAKTLSVLGQSMRSAGEVARSAFAEGVSTASDKARIEYVQAAALSTVDGTPTRSSFESRFLSTTHTSFEADGDAVSVGQVIASLGGPSAHAALSMLDPEQQRAVFAAAANPRDVLLMSSGGGMGPGMSTHLPGADPKGFAALVDAAASIPDSAARSEALGQSLAALRDLDGKVPARDRAEMADAVLAHLDDRTLQTLPPDGVAAFAGALAGRPEGPRAALAKVQALPPSAHREALARTLFLKTPPAALERDGALRADFAKTLAAGPADEAPEKAAERAARLESALSTDGGRALLADPAISGAARLWAAQQVMSGSAEAKAAMAKDAPWEDGGLAAAHARGPIFQHRVRGSEAVKVSGLDVENLVGAGLGVPFRKDFPQGAEALDGVRKQVLEGKYNLYAGSEAVEKVSEGIRNAQARMGGGEIAVATVPIQFSSQKTGPVDLKIYRVEGQGGQSRFVDNAGRVYDSFEAWRKENKLPPGKMTYPADGVLGEPGGDALVTENTPDTSDTFWEHVGDVADVAALVGGVVASGVILLGSGGTATPLVAGAWAVAIGSAGYMGIKAGAELYDRADHGQTLALTDPDARAAWLSLAGAGLTVAGAGAMRGATMLAGHGAKLAPQAARAAGILNASANLADAAGTVDQAHGLITNWDRMSPAQRMQVGLSIAFWGGMTGVSAKASGGKLSDAFSFRAQMNSALIESGAAVRPRADMAPGHASVRTGYSDSGRLELEVAYGPGTSETSVRIHKEVARSLIDNSGVQGAIRRNLGEGLEFKPGSRGEEVALEVAKHRELVRAYEAEIARAPESEQGALRIEQEGYRAALTEHEAELAKLKADPVAAKAPGVGHVDAVSSRTISRLRAYAADAKTRATSPDARARIETLEARLETVAANFEKNKVPTGSNTEKAMMYMVAEIDRLAPPSASARSSTARPKPVSFASKTNNPAVALEAAKLYPETYRRLRGVSEHLFSGKKDKAQRLSLVQKMAEAEALHRARARIEGTRPGLGPNEAARTTIDPATDFPMGFASRSDFDGFKADLASAMAAAAGPGGKMTLQGSSLGGRRFERTVDFDYTGEPFDVGRISDYDMAIESDALVQRAKDRGMTLPTDRALTAKEMDRLGLGDLYRAAQRAALERTGLAHEVNFKIFPSGEMPAKGLSLPVVE